MNKFKKKYVAVIVIVLVIVLLFIGLAVWLNTGNLTQAKIMLLGKVPYPLAMVNGYPVMANGFAQRYNLVLSYSQNQAAGTGDLGQTIFNAVIGEEKLKQVAGAKNVYVTKKQLDSEYEARAGATEVQGQASVQAYLQSRGLSETSFKSLVLEPMLLKLNLQTWFYGQRQLNSEAYEVADSLKNKIDSGQSMGVLAKNYSQDPQGQLTDGDMGFMAVTDLLPEMQEAVDSLSVSQVKIIPSRLGLHLVKLEEKDNNGANEANRVHLREIFIKGSNFDSWLETETQNLVVRSFIKI